MVGAGAPLVSRRPPAAMRRSRIESRALADPISRSSEHFIIAAVNNDTAESLGPRRQHAARLRQHRPLRAELERHQTMRSLENDYGLREVSAWPIAPLAHALRRARSSRGHGSPYLAGGDGADRRIKLAQPLQSFATRSEHTTIPMWACSAASSRWTSLKRIPGREARASRVAIIDTGADIGHPDLQANVAAAVNFVDSERQTISATVTVPKWPASSRPSPTIAKASWE